MAVTIGTVPPESTNATFGLPLQRHEVLLLALGLELKANSNERERMRDERRIMASVFRIPGFAPADMSLILGKLAQLATQQRVTTPSDAFHDLHVCLIRCHYIQVLQHMLRVTSERAPKAWPKQHDEFQQRISAVIKPNERILLEDISEWDTLCAFVKSHLGEADFATWLQQVRAALLADYCAENKIVVEPDGKISGGDATTRFIVESAL
jgi:hypothetical protein